MLGVAEGEAYLGFEPEAQKSALLVIINCVGGPQFKVSSRLDNIFDIHCKNLLVLFDRSLQIM